MSSPKLPIGDGNVPDKALEELLAAFAVDVPQAPDIDLDDPSIDKLLGLGDSSAEIDEPDEPDEADPAPNAPDEPVPAPDDPAPAVARIPIQIGGDDLPDAVYLDEEAEERLRGTSNRSTEASVREERNTILIGGDEIEGSSGGIPIGTGTSMDPRLRARRIAVRRAAGLKRLKWFVLAAVIILLITAGLVVVGSGLFAVEHVTVSGQVRTNQADVDAAVDQLMDTPVLLVNEHAIEAKLERSPWVREARVTTDFPHSASIELLERVPLATYLGADNRWRIIDVQGHVVEVLEGQPIEFMTITGPAVDAERGDYAGDAFTRAAELVESLSPAVRSRTAAVEVSDNGELSLRFHSDHPDDGTLVVLGAPIELLDKLTRLEALIKNTDIDGCTRIDVSTPEIGRQCPP